MVTKAEAEMIVANKEAQNKNKAQRLEIAKRIKGLIDESGNAKKTKEGKTLYNKYLVEKLGFNKATASHYLNGNEQISMDNIIRMSNHFGCCIEYLTLKSDSRNFKFDEVVKHIGLNESVVETLHVQKHKQESGMEIASTFLDTVNLLLDSQEGLALIFAIMRYKNIVHRKNEAYAKYIADKDLSSKWISNCHFIRERESLESFADKIRHYSFPEGELTDEQIESLFNYVKETEGLDDIDYLVFECNTEMTRFLDFIKQSETEGTTTQGGSLLKSFFRMLTGKETE